MAGQVYKVIIQGVASGRDPAATKKSLAALFKSNSGHLNTLLSGKAVVVKKTPDKETALKLHKALCQAGANCKVVMTAAAGGPVETGKVAPKKKPAGSPAGPATVRPQPAPPKQEKPAPQHDFINPMTCPACGRKQEKADECMYCGIIIMKYIKKTGKMPPEYAAFVDEEPEEERGPTIGDHFGDEIGESYSFWAEAPLAFVYPFKGNGLFILVAGAIFFGVLKVIPFLGLYKWMIMGFIGGYLAAYMFKVVNRSADKQDNPPNWPSLVNMGEDLAAPFIRMLIPGIFCYIPVLAFLLLISMAPGKVYDYTGELPEGQMAEVDETSPYFMYNREMESQGRPPFFLPGSETNEEEAAYEEVDEDSWGYIFWKTLADIDPKIKFIIIGSLILMGSFYYPMSILTVAMSGSLLSLSPHIVVPGIFKTFIPYIFTCFLYMFAIILKWLSDTFIAIPIPLTGPILEMFVTIYFLMVEARLLGVLYNANADRLGWYED